MLDTTYITSHKAYIYISTPTLACKLVNLKAKKKKKFTLSDHEIADLTRYLHN